VPARSRILLAAVVDLLLVGLFVVIGRASHREDQSAFLVTYWPFAVGLAVGWLVSRAWRRPFALLHAGVPAWLGTVVIGMLLRALVGQGVQVAFVVVATIVVGALLVGWRVLLVAIDRRTSRPAELPGPLPLPPRRRR
jgi:hypothetical protein